MRGLSASELLDIYERGRSLRPAERAILMVDAAIQLAGTPAEQSSGAMSVGRRNAALFALRAATFGPVIRGVAPCPACAARLDLEFAVEDLARTGEASGGWFDISIEGFEVRARLPTAADLVFIEHLPHIDQATQALLTRCVEVRRVGSSRQIRRIPRWIAARIGAELAAADPQAIADLAVRCPACDADQVVPFDIASFLWLEVETRAPRLLRDVHDLAAAHGWSEQAVLAMSSWRRESYLAQVRA